MIGDGMTDMAASPPAVSTMSTKVVRGVYVQGKQSSGIWSRKERCGHCTRVCSLMVSHALVRSELVHLYRVKSDSLLGPVCTSLKTHNISLELTKTKIVSPPPHE